MQLFTENIYFLEAFTPLNLAASIDLGLGSLTSLWYSLRSANKPIEARVLAHPFASPGGQVVLFSSQKGGQESPPGPLGHDSPNLGSQRPENLQPVRVSI